jgi:hypothetical protein
LTLFLALIHISNRAGNRVRIKLSHDIIKADGGELKVGTKEGEWAAEKLFSQAIEGATKTGDDINLMGIQLNYATHWMERNKPDSALRYVLNLKEKSDTTFNRQVDLKVQRAIRLTLIRFPVATL